MLTPSLLPERFFSLFGYICSQFADFRHGSEEWTNQLIPNWQRFLNELLKNQTDERAVRLIPVSLIILREHGKSNATAETGWIDLAEWAMLAVWGVERTTESKPVREAIKQMWGGFYIAELASYYEGHYGELAVEHSLEASSTRICSYVERVVVAVSAFWHVARLGLLAMNLKLVTEDKDYVHGKMRTVANWLAGMINANPSTLRPLIDLHHIELFLLWKTFWQVGRKADIYTWLQGLGNSLFLRRARSLPFPFIEGGNSLELVFEAVATGKKPPEFCDQSSFLMLCILELCFSLEPAQRDKMLDLFYGQIVLGRDSYGQRLDCGPLDLIGWAPPEDWDQKVLVRSLADEGESQTLETFGLEKQMTGGEIAVHLGEFIRQSRNAHRACLPENLPASLIVLACLKHRSPLPPELWRVSIFGQVSTEHQELPPQ